MKKNKMMRIASVLLVAVLVSTCAISGTFAKYVSSGSASDTARVAKWGVRVTGTGDMFKTSYENHDKIGSATAGSSISVNNGGADSMRLVAPGTDGSFVGFTVTGIPEVATRVTYTLDTIEFTGWQVDVGAGPEEYFPIIFTINDTTYGIAGIMDKTNHGADVTYSDMDSLKEGLKAAVAAYTRDYPANQNLSEIYNADLEIGWEWAFEYNDDAKDTALGDQAAGLNESVPSVINIAVTCTVTQID